MNIRKPLILFFTLVSSSAALAQLGQIPGANDPSKADLRVLTENHSLLSTTVTPMELSAEGYVVGFDEGTMDVDTLKDFISQFREQKKRAQLNVHNAVDTHIEPIVTPPLEPIHQKKKKSKKKKVRVNFQAQNTAN